MVVSKVKPVEKQNDKNTVTLISNEGSTSRERNQSNSQNTEMRMTFRCPKDLIDRLDKMRKGRAGRLSRNQAIIEMLDARLPR
jgi:hypothetical protein